MTIIGKVIGTKNNMATVSVSRPTTCGENCAMCKGCSPSDKTTETNNDIGAEIGSMVQIEMEDGKVLTAAFFVYIFPLIIAFTGAMIAYFFTAEEQTIIITGIISFIFPFAIIFSIDQYLRKNKKYQSKIVKIIRD